MISIAAEWAYEAEQNAKMKEEQEEAKRDAERQRRMR